MTGKEAFALLKTTYDEWNKNKAPRLGAALAYYTIFSIAPLLIIVIAIAGLAFGHANAQKQIMDAIQSVVGTQGAQAIQAMLVNASSPKSGIAATIIGVVTLLLGAAGVFGQLKDALNTIWEVEPKPGQGFMSMIRERFLSFSMVLGVGFLLLVSLVVSAGLSALGAYMNSRLPGGEIFWQVINLALSFGIITLLFAMLFRYLPDVEIPWNDVRIGALGTAFLFTVGKAALGIYLGRSSVASAYGAAGSLVVVLLWIYYSSQILFFGAEFTKVYAEKYGSRVVPKENTVPVTDEARAKQGISASGGNGVTPAPAQSTPAITANPPGPAAVLPARMESNGDGIGAKIIGLLVVLFVGKKALNRAMRTK